MKELGKYDDSKIAKSKICKMEREEFEEWRKNWNLEKWKMQRVKFSKIDPKIVEKPNFAKLRMELFKKRWNFRNRKCNNSKITKNRNLNLK